MLNTPTNICYHIFCFLLCSLFYENGLNNFFHNSTSDHVATVPAAIRTDLASVLSLNNALQNRV